MQVRTERISGLRAILGICIFLFAFFPATRVSAQCAPPHYQEGQIWENSESTVLTAISIHLTDFAPPKLICLANALKQRYGDRKRTTVLIFSSADAAKRYLPYQPDYAPANGPKQERLQSRQFWVSHLHALYSYDPDNHKEYVDIRPLGSDSNSLSPDRTRIDLPTTAVPHCRLEMSGRCLLELRNIFYPAAALKQKTSGSIALTGTIARSGKITDIKVAEVNVEPAEGRDLLANEAVRNLMTWRFEPREHEDALRIAYTYTIDNALPNRDQTQIQWTLPNEVTIKGNPPE